MSRKTVVIIGGGPAGLTAAFELLTKGQGNYRVVVLEKSDELGGISRTINYKGNRIDIGGHRFFSKSDRVMQWWMDMMPVEAAAAGQQSIAYQNKSRTIETSAQGPDPKTEDTVMLLRERKSRIYYLRRFFDYPVSLSVNTLKGLGLLRTIKIGASYSKSVLLPIKNETNLEQFFINRFGRELYLTFFKSYTEKVWGTACQDISAEWGAQRIKGLSITKTVTHMVKKVFQKKDLAQKGTETSLIEQFLYPKFGPGQMWEEAAKRVRQMGGEILMNQEVDKLHIEGNQVKAVVATNKQTGVKETFQADYVFSTMPIQELVRSVDCEVPSQVKEISEGLLYRDFITVGLLLTDMKLKDETPEGKKMVKDNWIYVQEPDVLVGRLQIFNNWSPYMVSDPNKVWIGLEYFCNENDELWKKSDADMVALGKQEMARIGVIEPGTVVDAVVIHQPKTYPAYFGTYERFGELRSYLDGFENLFLVGRNGMHKYNNQDHSMLTAMVAVENILAGIKDKANIWAVNTEMEYHEEKKDEAAVSAPAESRRSAA